MKIKFQQITFMASQLVPRFRSLGQPRYVTNLPMVLLIIQYLFNLGIGAGVIVFQNTSDTRLKIGEYTNTKCVDCRYNPRA